MNRELFPSSETDTPQDYIQKQERWLSNRQPELNRWAYILNVSGFAQATKMVTGEANDRIFDREEFISALREGLNKNPKATVTLVFHSKEDKEEARLDFKDNHPQMMGLKNNFSDRVHLYWTPIRPKQHYAVVDDNRVLFEQPKHPSRKSWWGHIVEDVVVAREWEKRFDEYVGLLGPELEF